jgi:Ran GTPase-activating protein (RanGAP) involved in mRNA processing and transport
LANDIYRAGTASIAKVLPQCGALTCLIIGSNSLGDFGATCLALALPKCKLNKIDIQYSQIGDIGADSLGLVLQKCPALKEINLNGNPISDDASERLGDVLIEHRPDIVCSLSKRFQD